MQQVTEIYFARHAKTTFIPSEYERVIQTIKYNEWAQMKMPEVYKFVYRGLVFMHFERIELE